ncbi:MAG: single-stranded-DNA-specific exonuclease [Patescibacteria group bacterium]|nr:single-stranded-DNA-specific exonuclease [Patescibacteria group bacterium]
MAVWKIKEQGEKYDPELEKKYHPLVLRLLAQRGLASLADVESFFNSGYGDLQNPLEISGMEKAVERIILARDKKEKIAIFGDYDADGVTASAILFEVLTELGAADVISYIPDRQLEGYGMNEDAVDYLQKENVELIITVDCGITNIKEVGKANNFGIDVIVTDHHHIPKNIPDALAVINPNLEDSDFKCKNLAGVGVAFALARGLYQKINPEKSEQLKWMLDLAAIGTVADCVPLLGENRTLVKYGLIVLSKTKRAGLKEMFSVGRIEISEDNIPDARKVAFQIAPRINASGRMDHASHAYKMIIEKDTVKARELALEVESKNQERQKVTVEIVREVQILANNSFRDEKFIFAANPHWPVGVLGLVAGKIADEFRKPTIILQEQEKENVFVGSLRSVPEVDIMKILNECSEFLTKFGGHSQAAGVAVARENMEKFYEAFSAGVTRKMEGVDSTSSVDIDAEVSASDINWDLVNDLKKMEPFGVGNEEPVFSAKNMIVVESRVVGNGSKHLKLSLRAEGSPKVFDAIGFSMGEKFSDLASGDIIDAVFNLQEDEWNGNKKMQLKLIDLKKANG